MSLVKDLQSRKSAILHKQIKDRLINGIFAAIAMVALGAAAAAIAFYSNDGITTPFLLTFPVFGITVWIMKKIHPYTKLFVPKTIELTFKQWLNYYNTLSRFDPLNEKSVKNIVSDTKSLSFSISGWSSRYAPSAVQIIPTSICNTLENEVVNLLQSKEKEKITKFSNYFLGVCDLLSRREPTFNEWIKISKDFIHITTGRSIDSIHLGELVTDDEPPIDSTQDPNEIPFSAIIKNPLL